MISTINLGHLGCKPSCDRWGSVQRLQKCQPTATRHYTNSKGRMLAHLSPRRFFWFLWSYIIFISIYIYIYMYGCIVCIICIYIYINIMYIYIYTYGVCMHACIYMYRNGSPTRDEVMFVQNYTDTSYPNKCKWWKSIHLDEWQLYYYITHIITINNSLRTRGAHLKHINFIQSCP